jgi:integrase
MPSKRLTDKSVRGLKAPSTGQTDYWDELLPGFGIRVGTTGRKSFFVWTRVNGTPERTTLKPPYPLFGLGAAREEARRIIADAQQGISSKTRKRREAKGTFAAVAKSFMTDFAHSHRTRDEMQRKFDVELKAWHDLPIDQITRGDIKELLREKARKGGSASNRLRAQVSKFFNWCVDEEIIETSPAVRLPRYGEDRARERVLSADEIKQLWPAYDVLGYPFGGLYKMMLCTAQRRGEVASMKWSQIGPDGWRLPAANAKTKVGHLVPLSSLAREILESVPKIGEYVFRSDRGDAPLQGWSKAKARLDKLVTLDEPWVVEDARRTAATHMRSLGVDRLVIDKILNHSESGTTKIYDRWSADPEKTAAMERWANRLREIISGEPQDNVVHMRRGA